MPLLARTVLAPLHIDVRRGAVADLGRILADGQLTKITKLMDPAAAFGEYIGANIIEASAAAGLADALRTTWERNPDLYYEDGFQEYANRGGEVRAATIGELDWVEVDNHDDLAKARDIACRY